MTAITAITIDGSPVTLADVENSITITHGRGDISNSGQPSTCRLAILLDTTDPIPATIGSTLTVEAHSTPRFTGTVTAVTVTHDGSHVGYVTRCSIDAVGYLDRLDRLVTGTADFLEETFEDRATGILAATGLTYAVSNDDGTILIAETAEAVTVREYLQKLCVTVGATMCDLPDGTILLETYTRREANYTGGAWADATGTWADNTQTWGSGRSALELPSDAVEWEPVWMLRQDTIVNDVTVAYGSNDPKDTVTDTDAASVTAYGKRSAYLDTGIKNLADATARAAAILTAQALPHWNIDRLTVLVDDLDVTTRDAVLALESGDRVIINNLPQAAPEGLYFGVVEGWTETHTPIGHRITLNLSDPRFSYAMVPWSDVSGSLTWGTANVNVTWSDAVLASDLI